MAAKASDIWSAMSADAREVFGWAAACEKGNPDVGTRALLVGLLRTGGGSNPAVDLLRHFNLAEAQLFDALGSGGGGFEIDPYVRSPMPLYELPTLTANARWCVARAVELQSGSSRPELDSHCLFGAILDSDGTARSGLSELLGRVAPIEVSIDQVSAHYLSWLQGNGISYAEALAKAFPIYSPAGSGHGDQFSAAVAGSDAASWPFLVIVRREAGGGSQSSAAGLGLLTSRGTVLTAVPASEIADAVLADGSVHQLRVLKSEGRLIHAGLDPLPSFSVAPQEIVNAETASEARFAAVTDIGSIQHLTGRFDESLGEAPGVLLYIASDPLPTDCSPLGSPVLDHQGRLAGIVVAALASEPTLLTVLDSATLQAVLALYDAASPPVPISIGNSSGAGNDIVAGTDQLGFEVYVSAFADLITSAHTKPPLTIGIFGSWGMGKSFLLEHIRRTIDQRQTQGICPGPRIHTVTFNAWEYSSTDAIWPALVRKIVKELDQLNSWPRRKRVWTRLQWNLRREWRSLRIRLATSGLVTAVAVAVAVGNSGLTTAIVATGTALGVGGLIKAANDPVGKWVTALFADADYGGQIRLMEDVKHDLDVLERRLHETDDSGTDKVTGRILVVIDDLDRCEPAKAVEVLQAVNLLLNFSSFVVCLGIDARIITAAIEKHYEGLLGTAGASGYEYLDKIVQIPFRIPEPHPDEIGEFIRCQLEVHPEHRSEPPPPPSAATNTSRTEAVTPIPAAETPSHEEPAEAQRPRLRGGPLGGRPEPARHRPAPGGSVAEVPFTGDEQRAFEMFLEYLRPNPRHVKRLINVYRLVRSLGWAEGERLVLDRPAAVLRWLIMWGQWPYTSLVMLRRFDAVGVVSDAWRPDADPLLYLLDQVQGTIDDRVRARHDDDPAKLRGLLAVDGCRLSVDEIKRIRRYTVNFNPAVEEYQQPAPATAAS
jgi:KAP family P-loop domain